MSASDCAPFRDESPKKSCVMGLSPIIIAYLKGIAAIFQSQAVCATSQCRVQYGFQHPNFQLMAEAGSFADRVKQQADIIRVVGEYVRLKKSGQNFSGLCPFHSEKTPSFAVHPVKQIYHC